MLHLDQKASRADIYKIQLIQVKKHDFQDLPTCKAGHRRRKFKSKADISTNPKQASKTI